MKATPITDEQRKAIEAAFRSAAFPISLRHENEQFTATGMTKRELYAALAMHAFLTADPAIDDDHCARCAVNAADALLAALTK